MKLRASTLVLTFLAGLSAQAAPILFEGSISSGTASRGPIPFGGFSGNVSGPGFNVFLNGGAPGFYPDLTPGTHSINDGGGTGGGDCCGGGSFDLNGNHYACSTSFPPFFSDCGSGFAIRYTLSDLPDFGFVRPFVIDFTAPFTAEVGFGCAIRQCGSDYSLHVSGSGIATVTLLYAPDSINGDIYLFRGAKYVFTPEPGTMTLAGLGLLAVILLRRRTATACAHI
jgi:hypothetical protein